MARRRWRHRSLWRDDTFVAMVSKARRGATSDYYGVGWSVRQQRWQATPYIAGRSTFCGSFEREEDAAIAVDRVLLGRGYAPRNFPRRRLAPVTVEELREARKAVTREHRRRFGTPNNRSTEYRGVRIEKQVFRAYLYVNRRTILLGSYGDARSAAIARDRAVLFTGIDEALNFPAEAAKLGPCSPDELRRASRVLGSRNTKARYFGVSPNPFVKGWWDAKLAIGGKPQYIARYATEEDAARAHDRAALAHLRNPQFLNFPNEALVATSIEKLRKEAAAARPQTRSSALHGVQKTDRTGGWPWLATITVDRSSVALGAWRTERDAALAHDRAALHIPGPRRKLNFPAAARKLGPASPAALRAEAWAQFKATKSSKYRGVSWSNRDQVWCAAIGFRGKRVRLGSFADEERAAEAYDTAARKLHKRRAVLNFPENEQEATPLRGRGTRKVRTKRRVGSARQT